jgi:lipopolysaccharide transport system ATP-binding protein
LAEKTWPDLKTAPGDDLVRLKSVRVCNRSGNTQQVLDSSEPIGIEIGYWVRERLSNLAAEFVVYDGVENLLFTSANQYDERFLAPYEPGEYLSTCWIPGNLMTEGTFFVRVSIVEIKVPIKTHVFEENILVFQVVDKMTGNSARGRIAHSYPGLIRPKLDWTTTSPGEGLQMIDYWKDKNAANQNAN